MKVRILKQTMAALKHVRPGDVLELPDAEARQLVAIGKAEPAPGEEPKPHDPMSGLAVEPEPDPAPKKKRKGSKS